MNFRQYRWAYSLTALSTAALISGCASVGQYQPGVYKAQAQGMNGQVPVTVTVSGNRIEAIEIGANRETAGIGAAAAPLIAKRIVDNQSLAIDAVSGATVTSRAVLAAVADSVKQAGGDVEALSKKVNKTDALVQKDLTTDLVIVGGGGAGMIAAINAREQGLNVILLEKMDFLGGASGICAGGMLIQGSKLQKDLGVKTDTPEKFVADMKANGQNLNDPLTLDVYAKNVGKTVDWLTGKGIELVTKNGVQERAEFKTPRMLLLKGGCPGYAQSLRGLVNQSGAEILLGTRAEKILMENGRAVGVEAVNKADGVRYKVTAKAVLLATGGYGANRDMLQGEMKTKLYYGPVSSTGDGHRMAKDAGAKLEMMQYAKIYFNGLEVAPGIAKSTLTGNAAALSRGAILVNAQGKRVVNEKGTGRSIVTAQAKQTGGQLYLVMDQATFTLFRNGIKNNGVSPTDVDRWLAQNGKGTPLFAHGQTLTEAANNAGIDAKNLEAEVAKYNGFVKAGVDKDFGRTAKNMTTTIGEGPYYIVEQKPRFATTMGSLVVNRDLSVVNTDGKVIEGLYAAGEVINSVHGDDSAPAANVGWAATSGKTASDAAVKFVRAQK